MSNIEKYRKIFEEILLLDGDDFEEVSILNTEQWDSLEHFNLINQMEECFGVSFTNEDINDFVSYSSGIEILKRYGVNL